MKAQIGSREVKSTVITAIIEGDIEEMEDLRMSLQFVVAKAKTRFDETEKEEYLPKVEEFIKLLVNVIRISR